MSTNTVPFGYEKNKLQSWLNYWFGLSRYLIFHVWDGIVEPRATNICLYVSVSMLCYTMTVNDKLVSYSTGLFITH